MEWSPVRFRRRTVVVSYSYCVISIGLNNAQALYLAAQRVKEAELTAYEK
jgi:hypothetical protein